MPCARVGGPPGRSSPSCSGNSPRPARIPRPPPSRPPPTSSSPPSRQPPPGQQRRKPGGQPGHTSHQRVPFPAEMLASQPTDYLLDACPALRRPPAADRRRRAHRRPAGRHRRRTPGDPRAPQPSGMVPPLPQGVLRPAPPVDRARRPGRAAADHRHRLPQGGLPRLVLHHPQVPPRRRRPDHLAAGNWPRSSAR